MMLAALAIDAMVGWPNRLYARIGHPVSWLGRLISLLDSRLNVGLHAGPARRTAGILSLLTVLLIAVTPAFLIQSALPGNLAGLLLGACLSWPLLAARSLHEHVDAVIDPLSQGRLDEAKEAVSRIVGRDTSSLDGAGVARAALESLAENTSDGVVAPIFWGTILGLPGIVAYKAINTLDSMIGHRNERHAAFGWASARLDDIVNYIPARLTGLLFAAVSSRPGPALRRMMKDSRHHRSPNAGWPEAAMAGSLGIRLCGPRVYGSRLDREPWLNENSPDPGAKEIRQALALYVRALAGMAGMLALLVLVFNS